MVTKHASALRQVLVQLIDGKLTLVPHEDGKGWHVQGRTVVGPLLDGPCAPKWCGIRTEGNQLLSAVIAIPEAPPA